MAVAPGAAFATAPEASRVAAIPRVGVVPRRAGPAAVAASRAERPVGEGKVAARVVPRERSRRASGGQACEETCAGPDEASQDAATGLASFGDDLLTHEATPFRRGLCGWTRLRS